MTQLATASSIRSIVQKLKGLSDKEQIIMIGFANGLAIGKQIAAEGKAANAN